MSNDPEREYGARSASFIPAIALDTAKNVRPGPVNVGRVGCNAGTATSSTAELWPSKQAIFPGPQSAVQRWPHRSVTAPSAWPSPTFAYVTAPSWLQQTPLLVLKPPRMKHASPWLSSR